MDGEGATIWRAEGASRLSAPLFAQSPALQVLWRVLDDETQQTVTKVCAGASTPRGQQQHHRRHDQQQTGGPWRAQAGLQITAGAMTVCPPPCPPCSGGAP